MRYALDAALAVLLIALVGLAGTAALAAKASLFAQALALNSLERNAIQVSEHALTHCPQEEIVKCVGEKALANEVVAATNVFELDEAPLRRGSGMCIRRLVLVGEAVKTAEFCVSK